MGWQKWRASRQIFGFFLSTANLLDFLVSVPQGQYAVRFFWKNRESFALWSVLSVYNVEAIARIRLSAWWPGLNEGKLWS
jgi:hypothetical protein